MEFEERIREQRTTEAIKKNLMGQEGKIYLISKLLGHEIVKENTLPEYLDFDEIYNDNPEEMPTYADDVTSTRIGHFYDGLNLGYHMEIKFSEYESSIKLYYKGYLKYHEEQSILMSYHPEDEWEKVVDLLFERASQKLESLREKRKVDEQKSFATIKNQELQRIRDKWGNII
jgi:hypothetical protein